MCNFTNKSRTGKLCDHILQSHCTGSENTRISQVPRESLLRTPPMLLFSDCCMIFIRTAEEPKQSQGWHFFPQDKKEELRQEPSPKPV